MTNPLHITDLEQQFLDLLRVFPGSSKEKPISSAMICGLLNINVRKLRSLVNRLRSETTVGRKIGSNRTPPRGYFYAKTAEELEGYIHAETSAMRTSYAALLGVKKAFDTTEQLGLEI